MNFHADVPGNLECGLTAGQLLSDYLGCSHCYGMM